MLPTRLERHIALRYLRGRKKSRFASLTTMIAVGGVAVGVSALIVVLGVMNGLRDDLRDRILVANPHLRMLTYGASLRMDNWREALDTVRHYPEVVAAAPEVLTKSIILNSAEYPAAIDVVGFARDTGTMAVTTLPRYLTQGDLTFEAKADSVQGAIVLGYRLAQRLSVYVGDVVTLVSPTSMKVNRVTGTRVPNLWKIEVTGIFDTGMYQYDDGFGVMDLATAQRFAGLGDAVTGIQIRVRDPWKAPEVGDSLQRRLGYPFRSFDWQSQNASLFSALQLEKRAMGLIIGFIMLVAAFNIIGTLTMVVAEKTKEIGILQAMGLTPGGIGRVFLAQGAVIGGVGTGIGLLGGLLLAYLIDASGLIRIDPAIYFIDRLPVHLELLDTVAVVLFSFLVAVVATLHPSRAAARLTPVEAIRHE
ncbi:MAG TPA: FtsX-like permease family protein [Gemmatimonadales bacterium]|jgi:lipoprotein-releasing system permease protein|nr:FtsX-like permease family protein [Gemmatimonadales bacterium]